MLSFQYEAREFRLLFGICGDNQFATLTMGNASGFTVRIKERFASNAKLCF